MKPVLIGCAHGTRAPEGQRVIRDLLAEVERTLEVEVREAYVDVQDPKVDRVVASIPSVSEGRAAVVVPLLLAGGYHVYVDIAQAVANRPDVPAAPPLGPDERLIDIVRERLAAAGTPLDAAVVLAAAGSSDPRSQADTQTAAQQLREHWHGPVSIGFAAGPKPSVADAVAQARADHPGSLVAVASYLLAPGLFQRRLDSAEADLVTPPLAPHPTIVEIIADRYRGEYAP